jgi:sugar phosphate isomerase/epimerase
MRLGFLTAALRDLALPAIVRWAGEAGFAALEVAAWPVDDPRRLNPAHLDVRRLDQATVRRLRDQLGEAEVAVSSLAFYENHLHPDPAARSARHDHLRACIDAAAALGVPTVGTFIGRDTTTTVADSLRQAEDVFPAFVERANRCGVRIVIENCLMSGWHPDGYPANLAYSPELWEWLAKLGLWLNYDPSHLVGIGADPVRALAPHVGLVAHAQAKDVEVLPGRVDRTGFFGNAVDRSDPWDHGWWRYRLPGLGVVDWDGIVRTLRAGGFTGVLSIEHEDPVHSGSTDAVQRGLLLARDTLQAVLDKPEGFIRNRSDGASTSR